MSPRRRDRFRRQVLGVLKLPPPKCEQCEGDTCCDTCGALFSPQEQQRRRERKEQSGGGV